MFWFYLFVFLVVVGLVLMGIFIANREKIEGGWGYRTRWTHEEFQLAGTWSFIFAGIILVVIFVNSIAFYTSGLNVEAKATSLQQSLYQRDQLVDMIRNELSDEQFEELMRATTTAEVSLIFSGSSVSDILITRSTQIVDLNSKYFAQYNEIVNKQIKLCNGLRNVFAPRFPGVGECRIDLVDGLPDRLDGYSGK
jgi:cytochrome bd-type quinol oxidase subunit 2